LTRSLKNVHEKQYHFLVFRSSIMSLFSILKLIIRRQNYSFKFHQKSMIRSKLNTTVTLCKSMMFS